MRAFSSKGKKGMGGRLLRELGTHRVLVVVSGDQVKLTRVREGNQGGTSPKGGS